MTDINKKETLAQSALGAELDDQELSTLAERLNIVPLGADEDLVREGDDRHTLFILAEGRLNVWKTVGAAEEVVYQMRAGECAGTRAFVDGSPRKAGLRAEGAAKVLTLEPSDFEALIDTHPRVVYKVMRSIFRITHGNLMRMNLESAEMRNYLLRTGGRY